MALPFTIEKMVYGGDGLARYVPDEVEISPRPSTKAKAHRGKTVLLPFVLEGEHVEANIVEEDRGFVRARVEKIVSPSSHRIQPGCPYFGECGGCHYQHSSYQHQLEIKVAVLRETLLRTAKIDWQDRIHVHASPPWNYRNRTRMKLQAQPFTIGYYRFGSHNLLPVEQCPISSPLINRALAAVWKLGSSGGLGGLAEMEFFVDAADAQLLIEIYLPLGEAHDSELKKLAEDLAALIPEIAGIVFFAAGRDGSSRAISAFGDQELVYQTASASYRVSAGSFFQTNRFMVHELTELVTAGRRGAIALDLYAGVGLLTVPLAKNFEKVEAVESAPSSCADLRRNVPANVMAHRTTTETFLAKLPSSMKNVGHAVVDPPRAGLGDKTATLLTKLSAHLTYLSCDPATLARDLKTLVAGGYRIEAIHLIDLFPQTFHIESAVFLAR